MYDIFVTLPEKMMHLFRNEMFMTIFEQADMDLENTFPHYGMILNYKHHQAKYKFNLKNAAVESFQKMTKKKMNRICVEYVIQLLNEQDMLNLCSES